MGGRNCCVTNCRRRSHDHLGRRIPNGLTFYCFPAWRTQEGKHVSRLTRRRRAAWLAAVGRSDITFTHIPSSMRVCSRHFHSGKPAYEMLESDPDWVPSLHLGHNEGSSRRPERLLQSVKEDGDQIQKPSKIRDQNQRRHKHKRPLQSVQEDGEQDPRCPAEMGPSHETESAAEGKPAYEMLESDPDWVPSLHLGHNEGSSRRPERLLQSVKEDGDQIQKPTKIRDQNQRRHKHKHPLQSVQEDGEQNPRCPAEMGPSHETESAAGGKPAYEMLESDPDWVPSLHPGHNEGSSRRPERLLQSVKEDRDQIQKPSKTRDQNQRRHKHKRPLQSVQEDRDQIQKPSKTRDQNQKRHKHKRPLQSVQEDRDQIQKPTKIRDQKQRRRKHKRPLQSVQEDGEQNQRRPAEMSPSHETESAAGGAERPTVRPWREVKSLLQSALQRPSNYSKQPVKRTDLDFRDFFRDALEASLEASSRSRALSARQPSSSEEFSVQLSFKLPPVEEEKQICKESSSSCENCARLQSRVMELQEMLSHVTGEQEDMEDSSVLIEAPVQPEQELQGPETEHTEEGHPEWTEPLSPPLEDEADPGVGSSKCKRDGQTRRFQKAWLKMFWFLRYSPELDQMWCHICRLYSDKYQRGKGLIRGSSVFKFHNIRNHSHSNYHKTNVSRHMLRMCSLQM